MRSYQAARNLFSMLGICSWAVIILGGILAFSGGTIVGTGMRGGPNGLSALLGAAPGFILAMLGFYGLALVQMGRAGVDSAEYSQQSLEVARKQLDISQQALDQGKQIAASYRTFAQPLRTGADATHDANSATPSYSQKPDESEMAVTNSAEERSLGNEAKNLLPIAMKIEDYGGKFLVNNQTFDTKAEALKYREKLHSK